MIANEWIIDEWNAYDDAFIDRAAIATAGVRSVWAIIEEDPIVLSFYENDAWSNYRYESVVVSFARAADALLYISRRDAKAEAEGTYIVVDILTDHDRLDYSDPDMEALYRYFQDIWTAQQGGWEELEWSMAQY